jgi:hypothetical protein
MGWLLGGSEAAGAGRDWQQDIREKSLTNLLAVYIVY